MIVVSFYQSSFRLSGIDCDAVFRLVTPDSHFTKFCDNGGDPVAFLKTDVSNPRDGDGAVGVGRDGSQSDCLIGAGLHIRRDTMKYTIRRGRHQDSVLQINSLTSHFL